MELDPTYQTEFKSLKKLLAEITLEPSVDALLNLIVKRMVQRPHSNKTEVNH